jgi:hypothetical protein
LVAAAKKADPDYFQKLERSRQMEADFPLRWDEESGRLVLDRRPGGDE